MRNAKYNGTKYLKFYNYKIFNAYLLEYYSAQKKKSRKEMNNMDEFKDIMLRGRSLTKKEYGLYYMISLIQSSRNKKKISLWWEKESRIMTASGFGGQGVMVKEHKGSTWTDDSTLSYQESGVHRCLHLTNSGKAGLNLYISLYVNFIVKVKHSISKC